MECLPGECYMIQVQTCPSLLLQILSIISLAWGLFCFHRVAETVSGHPMMPLPFSSQTLTSGWKNIRGEVCVPYHCNSLKTKQEESYFCPLSQTVKRFVNIQKAVECSDRWLSQRILFKKTCGILYNQPLCDYFKIFSALNVFLAQYFTVIWKIVKRKKSSPGSLVIFKRWNRICALKWHSLTSSREEQPVLCFCSLYDYWLPVLVIEETQFSRAF